MLADTRQCSQQLLLKHTMSARGLEKGARALRKALQGVAKTSGFDASLIPPLELLDQLATLSQGHSDTQTGDAASVSQETPQEETSESRSKRSKTHPTPSPVPPADQGTEETFLSGGLII
jgi:hypothetical protein